MTDERHTSVRRRSYIGFRLATTASTLALLVGLAAGEASAQTVIVGGSDDSVMVNTSVLDQLGPGGTPAYDGQAGAAYYGEPGYGNFPPPQMPRSFSNVGNLTPPPQRAPAPAQPAYTPPAQPTQAAAPQAPQPSTPAAPQPTYTAAPQPAQGTSSSSAGLTPTQRLQQPSNQPAAATTASATASQPSGTEDMSADPAATVDEPQQVTPTASQSETEVASSESPAAPASAVPESEPEPEKTMVEPEETAPSAASVSAAESATPAPVPASETADAAAANTPEPPPSPEPPAAPASATPAAPPPQSEEETMTADAAEPSPEPAQESAASESSESETAESESSGSEDTQTAALTTGQGPMQGGVLRVVFDSTESELPEDAKPPLKELAQKLLQEEDTRVQLMAYASGDSSESSRARRLSLSRALAVRTYLIDQGIRSTRMDVRALGNNVPDGPEDRVDIQAAAR